MYIDIPDHTPQKRELRRMLAGVLVTVVCLVLSGCKLAILSVYGGHVETESGSYSCEEGRNCLIEIEDTTFAESLIAIPNPGYEFVQWQSGAGFLCSKSGAVCDLSNIGLNGDPVTRDVISSDTVFYVLPIFKKAESKPSAAPDWQTSGGIQLGCSNTVQTVSGYLKLSAERSIKKIQQGGGSISEWAGTGSLGLFDGLWAAFDAAYASTGQGVFLQVCARRDGVADGQMDADLQRVLAMLTEDRGIPANQIWLTSLQRYPEPGMCPKAAPVVDMEAAVTRAIATFGVNAGPILTAASASWISPDNCHLSEEGQIGIGSQMVEFFDAAVARP